MAILRQTGAARWFAETQLAGPTRQAQSSVSVLSTTTSVIGNNGDRVGLVIVNVGSFDIFLQITPTGAPTTGIRLGANGGNVTMTVRDDYELVGIQWWAISVGGASLTTVIETISDLQMAPEQTVSS